ncbi:MAG: hypothetical protein ING84_09655 [Cytophagales bacterium]|nr:hypothetical protein [Cytophagales bacterium]MCA6366239.1 hypothetical protein [Cytophagales bacterium]MCA6371922.1 hypothetical protein [Cytophagales bacterium]MCA6376630.1 hypothetical protein [Cytophagales bacterium]MCA6383670.1 hypothetical protein [Cytophagales bacterium]
MSLGGEKGSEKNTCHEGTKTRSEVFLVPWCPIAIGLSGDTVLIFMQPPRHPLTREANPGELGPGYSLQSFCTNTNALQQKGFPLLSLAGKFRRIWLMFSNW